MVEIAVGRSAELESAEADLVQSLVINAESLIGVFYELMDGEGGIVWLSHVNFL